MSLRGVSKVIFLIKIKILLRLKKSCNDDTV